MWKFEEKLDYEQNKMFVFNNSKDFTVNTSKLVFSLYVSKLEYGTVYRMFSRSLESAQEKFSKFLFVKSTEFFPQRVLEFKVFSSEFVCTYKSMYLKLVFLCSRLYKIIKISHQSMYPVHIKLQVLLVDIWALRITTEFPEHRS